MSVLPAARVARIEWCEQHVETFTTNATAIGTTSAAVTAWAAKVAAARAAFDAQKIAQDNAKSATNTYNLAIAAMTDASADIIRQVKTQAGIVGDEVYSLANIPAPATPGPIGPLGQANNVAASLDGNGGLLIKWKCTNPKSAGGTTYQVWRRIGTAGEYTFLANVGVKEFVDSTVPASVSSLTYKIRAVRSTSAGPWATFSIEFGVGAGMTVSMIDSDTAPNKMAA